MRAGLHIQLLGEFDVTYDGAPVAGIASARLETLLAYLVLHRAAPQARQRLAFLFWPDSTEEQARTNLRNLWHRLRRALPDAERFLISDELAVQWRADAPCRLDVAEFEASLAQAQQADGPDVATQHLEQAVAGYGGELLPGCYSDWLLAERDRLAQADAAALERLAASYEARGDYRPAIGHVQPAEDPGIGSLSAGLAFVPGSATSNRSLPQPAVTLADGSQTLTWPALEIAAGEVVTIHFGVAAPATVGVYTNTAQAEVTSVGGAPRTLRPVEQVDVARSPTHDTVLQITPGVAYPPVEPDGLWTVAVRRGMPASVVSVTITSTPVCALPSCGPLKRFYALHDGQTYTLTLVPGTTDHYRGEIPRGQFNLNERIFLVTVLWPAAGQTLRQLSPVQAGGECQHVGGAGSFETGYQRWDDIEGFVPCTPTTKPTKFFDPSGYVTDARTGAPIASATVTLYRVGAAWPDTRSTTRQCRTVDTRPGGSGGTWARCPRPRRAWTWPKTRSSRPWRWIRPSTHKRSTPRAIIAGM